MSGIDLSSLANLTTNLGNLLPSSSDLLQSIATSAVAGVALAGVKAQMANGSIPDPLHLASGNNPPTPANNPNVIVGPTITASAYSALTPAAQASLNAAGVHVVAG